MSEKEEIIFKQFKSEKNEKKKEILYAELQKLRKEREAEQLKDCPFAH